VSSGALNLTHSLCPIAGLESCCGFSFVEIYFLCKFAVAQNK